MLEKLQTTLSTTKSKKIIGGVFAGVILVTTFLNYRVLGHEKAVILIEGEKPFYTNFSPMIAKNGGFLQGKSLELLANDLPEGESYFSIFYRFTVIKSGVYSVIFAGTPPGPEKPSGSWDWFSPYSISLDGGAPVFLTKETLEQRFQNQPRWSEYHQGGYHWIRIDTFTLEEGEHKIEIRINERRFKDQLYAFFLDGILLTPQGWKPIRLFSQIPQSFFRDSKPANRREP